MTTSFEIVPFHDQEILTVQQDGEVIIMMKPVIETLGLAWNGQFERIKRHPVISKGIRVTRMPSAGGEQEAVGLTLESFHGALLTISPDRIKDETARAQVIRYQEHAFRIVFEHFHGPIRIAPQKPASVAELLRVGNALKKERDPRMRALLEHRLDQIADSWNVARVPHGSIGVADPDYSGILREFWSAVNGLEEAGLTVNHSRRNHLIALYLPEIRRHFAEVGVPIDVDRSLTLALRTSKAPEFVADKPVNCPDGAVRHCWVFSRA